MALKKLKTKKYSYFAIGLMVLAGIIYNSWPLGYILDPSTAHFGMASDLEDANHPYNWLFIAGDIMSGILILVFAVLMYRHRKAVKSHYWRFIIIGLVLFGFFTAAGAGAPNNCLSGSLSVCLTIDHKTMGPDGIETSLAAFGLLIGLLGTCLLSEVYDARGRSYWFNWAVFLSWFTSGMVFIFEILTNGDLHTAQLVLLLLCGVSLISIGLTTSLRFSET